MTELTLTELDNVAGGVDLDNLIRPVSIKDVVPICFPNSPDSTAK